tara:strand:+ start:429 stop:1004 length:576 start_codon:yes stop_codon:yes gene_type:complete
MANYGSEGIRGAIDGPAIEAIRQMREEKTAERMRAIAALIARLQGHERTGQEQMGQSPRDQRFWMNEGARRAPTPLRSGGQRSVPRRMLPTLSPEGFHHRMLGEMESGPEPMYGKSRQMSPDFARQMARLVRQDLNPEAEMDTFYGNPVELEPMDSLVRRARAPQPGILGNPEVPRRGPPNMALRRRYLGW